jgi:hypothetical protein
VTEQAAIASAVRAVDLLESLGEAPPQSILQRLGELADEDGRPALDELGELLAPLVLVEAAVDEFGRTVCTSGGATPALQQHGWRSFLLRVDNPHGIAATLMGGAGGVIGPGGSTFASKTMLLDQPREAFAEPFRRAWLEAVVTGPTAISGAAIQFAVVSLYSRDAGKRTAGLRFFAVEHPTGTGFTTGPARVDLMTRLFEGGVYTEEIEFEVTPSHLVELDVREPDGRTTMAAVTVTDDRSRVYPSKAMRLAPDMVFQSHVYRAAGEVIELPPGRFTVSATRGPEYRGVERVVEISGDRERVEIVLDRWVDPAERGYYSADPHIHAAGCAHYDHPTEGVSPETMIRHVRGEGLRFGGVLTWGPCYIYQKQFFTGRTISPPATLEHPTMQEIQGMTWEPSRTETDHESMLHYDVEVSGFPSSHSGHAMLLGLTEPEYPGTSGIDDWPSWNLPILRWAAAHGATVGYAHCGIGLEVATDELPNYLVPSFYASGANELIVDVPLGYAAFQAGAEFSPASELNVWYHLLNVGYRTLMLGETDYPCAYDDRPGVGRSYVRLDEAPSGDDAFRGWLAALGTQPSYFGDGRSHVFDFAIDGDLTREQSRALPGRVALTASVAAWLPVALPGGEGIGGSRYSVPAGWHLERSRIQGTRDVLVEIVVNGHVAATQTVTADGATRDLAIEIELERSSWVAIRILRSVHAQPIFVEVGGLPIRASRRSAGWLADCVEALWSAKNAFIREGERGEARAAYDAARAIYLERRDESEVE